MTDEQKQRLGEIGDQVIDLKNQNKLEITEFTSDLFRPVIEKWSLNFSLYSYNNITFKHSNGETVCELYFRENWDFKSNKTIKDAYVSYYSTSTQSEFEYDRLEILGEITNIFRHKKQEFIDAVNNILSVRENEIRTLSEEAGVINAQIQAEKQRIQNEHHKHCLNLLMSSGLTFNKVRVNYLKNKRLYYYYVVSAVASKTNPKSVTYTVKLTTPDGYEIVEERVRENAIITLIRDSIEWEQLNKENNE
jgi:hypothetical protein